MQWRKRRDRLVLWEQPGMPCVEGRGVGWWAGSDGGGSAAREMMAMRGSDKRRSTAHQAVLYAQGRMGARSPGV